MTTAPPSPQVRPIAPLRSASSRVSVERLTALWALAEVALGGALHALKLPLTGIFVGGSAVLLLTLIAHAARAGGLPLRRTLLGATVVVLVLKGAVSPQSPLGAYVAVGFQGLVAALVLPTLGRRAGPFVLAVVALVESAAQKALVLAVLFGAPLWKAVDAFGDSVRGAFGVEGDGSLSVLLVGVYVGLHVVAGVAIGVLAGRLPERVEAAQREREVEHLVAEASRRAEARAEAVARRRRVWWRRSAVRRVLVVAAGLVVYAALLGRGDGSAWGSVAVSIGRAFAILAVWAFAVAPLVLGAIRRALRRRGQERAAEVDRAAALLPQLRALAPLAWRASAEAGPVRRLGRFVTLVVAGTLRIGDAG